MTAPRLPYTLQARIGDACIRDKFPTLNAAHEAAKDIISSHPEWGGKDRITITRLEIVRKKFQTILTPPQSNP
jgi:hypothetical protein